MSEQQERWGRDLRLLRRLENQNDIERGADLATVRRFESKEIDLDVYGKADNLKQALLIRFLTVAGELAPLGHPNYGSRLFELMGQPNTEATRNRAKLFVLQTLNAEARVKKVLTVDISSVNRTQLRINISLLPIDSDTILNLVFPFFLEGGQTP